MLDQRIFTSDARDNVAISYLRVGLDDAIMSGKSGRVRWIPTSHEPRELVSLATALAKSRGANVLVLGGELKEGVTFVPLK
jgi:hypothetical protein